MSDSDSHGKPPKKYDPPHSGALSQDERRELEQARADAADREIAHEATEQNNTAHGTGEHPITRRELNKAFNLNDVKQVVAMIIVAVSTCFAAYKFVVSEARAQADAGRTVLEQKFDSAQREFIRYQETNDASVAGLRDEMQQTNKKIDAVQEDLREFYKAWRDDRRSPRLEQPLARDGGR